MARPQFFYSEALMGYDMGPQHPLKPRRLAMTRDLLASYGAFEGALELTDPKPLTREEAAQTHDAKFLEVLERLSGGEAVVNAGRYGFGTGDNPIFRGMYESSLLYSGGSAAAAQAVVDGADVAFNIAGGLHHAHYARAAGFCILNDCAIGLRRLRQKFARVAYVDIDVHHGDGVQELFYDDPTVLTVSLHESGRTLFPGTGDTDEIGEGAGAGFSLNLPFAPNTTDDVWIEAWRASALPFLRAFQPEAILLQMGTDPHYLDPLAHVNLTAQGWLEAVRDVRDLGVPIVAVGGGGYNLTTVPRMWTLAVAHLAGFDVADEVPAAYAYRAEIPHLADPAPPNVDANARLRARRFADHSTAALNDLRRHPAWSGKFA